MSGGANGVNAVSSAAPGELGLVPEWQAVHFRFSESVQNLHVAKAHLWVFVSSNQSLSGAAWVTLYQVARDAVRGPHLVKVSRELSSRLVSAHACMQRLGLSHRHPAGAKDIRCRPDDRSICGNASSMFETCYARVYFEHVRRQCLYDQ